MPVEKVIVHHTATANKVKHPAAAIRSIYYYHAITRGWGDIGYNFLVDWQGNVYEGRFGGANVVGGHALQYNYGSMGIALLGDFSNVEPPDVMLDALMQAIEDRAPQVDVTTSADFVDLLQVPNLCGHGDVMATTCPGRRRARALPLIRGLIAGTDPIYLDPPIIPEGIQLVDVQIGPSTVYQGNLLEVRVDRLEPRRRRRSRRKGRSRATPTLSMRISTRPASPRNRTRTASHSISRAKVARPIPTAGASARRS